MIKILFRHFLCFLVSLYFLLHLVGCAITPAPISDKSGDYEFAELLEEIRQKDKLPAIAASVIINGDIYVKAAVGTRKYGTNNWVAVEDKFLIGSCGKAFTATLAAILINDGILDWSKSVGDVFPKIKMHPKWKAITIQHLLTNRSGYEDDPETKLLPYDQIMPLWHDNEPPVDMRKHYIQNAINIEPIYQPNEVVKYANSGFLVAGAMLETLSNDSFENLMQDKVFNPLELITAGYGSPATIDPISQPHGHSSNSPIQKDFPDYISPMGNVSISIGDWSKFVLFHLNAYQKDMNTSVLDSNTIQKLHTPPNSATWLYDGIRYSYAFGWITVTESEGNYLLMHEGQGSSFSATIEADPKTKSAILIVTNAIIGLDCLHKAAKQIRKYYAEETNLPNQFLPK